MNCDCADTSEKKSYTCPLYIRDIQNIDKIEEEVGTGITIPYYGEVNNTRIVIKLYKNVAGNRALVNELVSYKMADALKLPIPRYGVGLVDNNTFINESIEDIDQCNFGKCFYTFRINNISRVIESRQVFNGLSNIGDYIKIVIFDNLIVNNDRYNQNELINIKEKKLYIIDHSHSFGGVIWNGQYFKNLMEKDDYKEQRVMDSNKELYKLILTKETSLDLIRREAELFRQILTDNFIKEILNDIPNEWYTNKEDVEMLGQYICYRIKNIESICDVIYYYIQNVLEVI